MGGEDEGQAAGRTLCREAADAGAASCAEVAFSDGPAVAGAEDEAVSRTQSPRGEAHHEQGGGALLLRPRHRRRGRCKEEVSEVLLVQSHIVLAIVASVGLGAQLSADGDLGGEADDGDMNLVAYEVGDCLVNVTWVAGQESSVDDQDLAGAVTGSMTTSCQ